VTSLDDDGFLKYRPLTTGKAFSDLKEKGYEIFGYLFEVLAYKSDRSSLNNQECKIDTLLFCISINTCSVLPEAMGSIYSCDRRYNNYLINGMVIITNVI